MSEIVHVLAARIPDRDRLLALLAGHGHDARPVDEVGIDVHVEESHTTPAIYTQVEDAVMDIGDPFVPVKHQGVIYVRPPIG